MFFNLKINLQRAGKVFLVGVLLASIFLQAVPTKTFADQENNPNNPKLNGANAPTTQTSSEPNTGACIIWDRHAGGLVADAGGTLPNCVSQMLYMVLWIISFVVGVCTILFDEVFSYTVIHMSDFATKTDAIKVGWTILRDISNILFIFILLYLAIATILQFDEHGVKHSLSRLIVAAVLINFSLFFTKIVIDVPNIIAVRIYNSITANGTADGVTLGGAFMTIFQPQKALQNPENGKSINPQDVRQAQGLWNDNARGFAANRNPIITFVMGIIIDATIILVFLAVTIIFLKRFVLLIFLMIFSPLAFAGMAMPGHKASGLKDKFWDTLLKESFYAPIFMICVYITLKVGQTIVNSNQGSGSLAPTPGGGAVQVLSNLINVPYILGLSVIIVMLVASLIIAEEMGVSGASGAMSAYNGMKGVAMGAVGFGAGAAWNNSVGRYAGWRLNKSADSKTLAENADGKNGYIKQQMARAQIGILKTLSAGHEKKLAKEQDYAHNLDHEVHNDPAMLLDRIIKGAKASGSSTDRRKADTSFDSWNTETHANVRSLAEKQIRKVNDRLEKLAADRAVPGATAASIVAIDAETEKLNREIAPTRAAMQKYYTGGGGYEHGRIGDKAVEVERMSNDKLLNVHKNAFNHDVVRDATGKITHFTDGGIFKDLGDQQRGQLLSTYGKKDQEELAANTEFKTMLRKNVKDFDQLAKIANAATSDKMKEEISNIGYSAIGRQNLLAKLKETSPSGVVFKNNGTLQNIFKNMLIGSDSGVATTGRTIDEMMNDYESSATGTADSSFIGSENNLKRIVKTNTDYINFKKTIDSYK